MVANGIEGNRYLKILLNWTIYLRVALMTLFYSKRDKNGIMHDGARFGFADAIVTYGIAIA